MGRRAVFGLLLVSACFVSAQVDEPYKDIKVNGVAPCDDNDELTVSIVNHMVDRIDRSTIVVNATTAVTRELPADLSLKVEVRRCDSRGASSTCSQFFDKEFENFCDSITEPNAPWANAVKTTSPMIECPVKEDTFLTMGCEVDGSLVDNAPEGYWTAKVTAVRGDGEIIFCLLADAKITEAAVQ